MIRNYIKTAWRNLLKSKVYSTINILCLAIGLASFWLIALYIANELSYDRYNVDADRIFRVVSHAKWNSGSFDITGTSSSFAPTLKKDYPEIEETVRIDPDGGGVLSFGNKHLQEDDIYFADKTLFNIFTYHLLYGDKKTALANPQCIVLTQALAVKLFGNPANAVNQTVNIGNNHPVIVTGVIDNIPDNSHLKFSAVRSFPANFNEGWTAFHLITYLKLYKETDIKKLELKLPQFVDKYLKAELASLNLKNINYWLELQPLASIHLHSDLQAEISENGKISYIYIYSIIGLLILGIALINYMNLSTARASLRLKEIGIRKVNGSGKRQLINMFLVEAIVFTLISAFVALVIIYSVLPWYSKLTGKQISIWYFGRLNTLAILASFSFFTGIIGGIYPAFFLSGFRLIPALKGQIGSHSGNMVFRKILVTFQFVITICMIAGSLVIYQQLHYVLKKDLGFNKDQVLTFHLDDNALPNNTAPLKYQLLNSPLIKSVGAAGLPIGKNLVNLGMYNVESGGVIEDKPRLAHFIGIDEDFIPTMQLKLIEGRNYAKNLPTDKDKALIVNETLVKEAGWKAPIGKKIHIDGANVMYTVVGVVKDFHFFSLQHQIEPLLMPLITDEKEKNNFYVRVDKNNIPEALNYIKQTYQQNAGGYPINYSFLDQNFAKQYDKEQRQGNILITFTILAITIACLGLFGLITFVIGQRLKEIGIRKVLGASVNSIVELIAKDFIKLVFIAAIIAFPVSWWVMNKWLQGFTYRINIGWWVFALAGGIAVFISLITVSFQAIKAAIANPVKSLRSQ